MRTPHGTPPFRLGAQAEQPAVFPGTTGSPPVMTSHCIHLLPHPLLSMAAAIVCDEGIPPGMSAAKARQVGEIPGRMWAAALCNLVLQLPLGPKTTQSAREHLRLKAPQGLWQAPYVTGAENCPRTGQDADAVPSPLDAAIPMQCSHAPCLKLRGISQGLVQNLHLVRPCGTGCNSEGMGSAGCSLPPLSSILSRKLRWQGHFSSPPSL